MMWPLSPCPSDCFLSHKGATSSILTCASRAVLCGLCAIRLGPRARGGSAVGRPSTALAGAASSGRFPAPASYLPAQHTATMLGPAAHYAHPPLPGIVPRPLHTAPPPALDAAGHQPSSPPPRLHPSPAGQVSTRSCLSVRHTYSYLLLRESTPSPPPTHTLSVTCHAMSCNVHAVWTAEQSLCRTSLNAAHSAYLLVSPPERAPPASPALQCRAMYMMSVPCAVTLPYRSPCRRLRVLVPPPGREGSLPLSATHYVTCNTLHAVCENGPAPPPPA